MRELVRPLALVAIVLAIPIATLLVWGELLVDRLDEWREAGLSDERLALITVAVLASDILLPVPSSAVSTLAGAELGWFWGTVWSWVGLMLGASVAFAVARAWGRPVAERLTSAEDLNRLERTRRISDAWLIIATRPLPVLAEACVLLVGLLGTPWRRLLPALAISNLAIAATFSILGEYALRNEWLPIALCTSLALPVLVATVARRIGHKRGTRR